MSKNTYLMLHDVRDKKENFFPKRYEMESFLSKNDFIAGINNLDTSLTSFDPRHLAKENTLNEQVFLTFDDGLKDHIWVAEYLRDKNISAIFLSLLVS